MLFKLEDVSQSSLISGLRLRPSMRDDLETSSRLKKNPIVNQLYYNHVLKSTDRVLHIHGSGADPGFHVRGCT